MDKVMACGEIWCGIKDKDMTVTTSGLEVSLFSAACEGGKGGDIYYFSVCESDLLSRIAIADVLGHGAAVADTSQWMCNSLRSKMNNVQGNEVLAELNVAAVDCGYKAITTAAVVAWYREQKKLFYTYAGHPPALLRRTTDSAWHEMTFPPSDHVTNTLLGINRDFPYDQETLTLASGDTIFMYTDGIIETPDATGQIFGIERLQALLNTCDSNPQTIRNTVLSALQAYAVEPLIHDDLTFMAIRIK